MPDTDPVGYAATLQGEHAHHAEVLRRAASDKRAEAADLDAQAAKHEQRAEWAGELAEAYSNNRDHGERE